MEILVQGRDRFTPTARTAQTSAKGLGGGMQSLGKMAVAAGVGFLAARVSMAGVQRIMTTSIGAAAKYEAQMAQIRALTGATKEDTNFLTGAIRNMQKSVPKSSAELGAAAYFILSSGISDAADAAEVLEIAAKASTVGLGETAVVADALTTVLNAYQFGADKAGRVTDILMQAVKDGKAEADAFAGVLGRVVPIASQMGISFEQVAANMATFTRLGVSAEEAATGLRGVMSQMLQPAAKSQEKLAEIGLTFQELRQQIREKGLMAVLQTLMERFAGNEEAIATLFPDVRGLTNVLATAGVQADTYAEILGNMDTATGNLDRGFKEVSQTASFRMQKAMNDLNVALEEIGQDTLPAVVPLVVALTAAMRTAVAVMTPWSAASRDVSRALGRDLARAIGAPGILGDVSKSIPLWGDFVERLEESEQASKDFARAASDTGEELSSAGTAIDKVGRQMNRLPTEIEAQKVDNFSDTLLALGQRFDGTLDQQRGYITGAVAFVRNSDLSSQALARLILNLRAAGQSGLANALEREILIPMQQARVAFEELDDAAQTELPSVVTALDAFRDSTEEAMKGSKDAIKGVLPTIDEEFDEWRDRLADMADDYREFEPNLRAILDALVREHVDSPERIILALEEAGPGVTAAMAKHLAQGGTDAVSDILGDLGTITGTNIQAMTSAVLANAPGFRSQLAKQVSSAVIGLGGDIGDVLAVWNILGSALSKGLKPGTVDLILKFAIQASTSGFNIGQLITLSNQLKNAGLDVGTVTSILLSLRPFLAIKGAQHGFHGVVTSPTMILAGEGGRPERVDISPGASTASGGGPVINLTLNLGTVIGTDERAAMELANFLIPELRRAFT